MSNYIPDCSGLVKNNGKLDCKHGFIVYPSCRNNPMKKGVYKYVPCMDLDTTPFNKIAQELNNG